jgi:6-pyruvoyltetrahydropterin/6-carboxytetrahydropterin synthase
MFTVTSKAHFDAAHFLALYAGKCRNIHGHRWEISVTVAGNIEKNGEKRGMVVDFGDLKRDLRSFTEIFDHTLIFEHNTLSETLYNALREEGFALSEVPFRPTAENFAKYFYDKLYNMYNIRSVTVFETPENSATYIPDSIPDIDREETP